MKKKNAFTLIELLAIIVILAIIAVITVPIILNVIENSKKGAATDSAYGYASAIQRYYLTKLIDNYKETQPTGKYDITNLPSDFKVDGKAPSEGCVQLKDGEVITYSLKFDNYTVTKNIDSNPVAEKNGEIAEVCKPPTYAINTDNMTLGIKVDNIQYFTGGTEDINEEPDNIVYFDPINGIVNCETYHTDNSKNNFNGVITGENSKKTTDNQTSCLKWFVYSIDDKGTSTEKDDIVNMILDHSTTIGIRWVTNENWTTAPSNTNVTYPSTVIFTFDTYNNRKGPLTLLKQLYDDTNEWTSNKIIQPSPYTIEWGNAGANNYTITYLTKARLIEIDEVAKIKGDSNWKSSPETSAPILTNNYTFLKKNIPTGYSGIWTSTPYAFTGHENEAWIIHLSGIIGGSSINQQKGLRPVISIYKTGTI